MKENFTTTTDKIWSMTDDEYFDFKKKYAGVTIRALVNKKNDIIDRNKLIIALKYKGMSQDDISELFGISQQAVCKIIHKEGRKEINGKN